MARVKLVDVSKQGNSFVLRLEDNGWAWAAAHLGAEVPAAYQVLQAFLIRLGEHLHNADITLADFIGSAPEMPENKKLRPKTRPKTSKPQKPSPRKKTSVVLPETPSTPLDAVDVRREIELAYLKVTNGRKGVDAKLSEVRAQLSHLKRETVDIGLGAILKGDDKARLIPTAQGPDSWGIP